MSDETTKAANDPPDEKPRAENVAPAVPDPPAGEAGKKMEICADAIILYHGKLVFVRRLNTPKGLALVGGRMEYDESLEECIVREGREECGLTLDIIRQLGTYSRPNRDTRGRKVTTVFLCVGFGELRNETGKTEVVEIEPEDLPKYLGEFVFDHATIVLDYLGRKLK